MSGEGKERSLEKSKLRVTISEYETHEGSSWKTLRLG